MYSQNISHTQVTHLSINGDIVIEKISYNTSLTAFKHGFKYVTELEDQFMPDMSTYTSEASLPTNASGSKINNQNFYAMPAHTEISISAIGPNYRPVSLPIIYILVCIKSFRLLLFKCIFALKPEDDIAIIFENLAND